MTPRAELVRDFILTCPPDSYTDYCIIAEHLERGFSPEYILDMPELEHWPAAYTWLKDRLKVSSPLWYELICSRVELVPQLLATHSIGSDTDCCRIVAFLERGYEKDHILAMPELDRWPVAAKWLAERL